MMPSHSKGLTDLEIARYGGLKHLICLLRLSGMDIGLSQDVIFVSIDLEVSRQERAAVLNNKSHIPHVKELGIACFDTRLIFTLENPPPGLASNAGTRLISTTQFSTSNASKDFEDCDFTDFQECVFAETFRINQRDLAATTKRHLQFKDSTNSHTLRNIAIVGHSVKSDLGIIQRLGVDICRIAPVIAVIDTHSLSRYILKSGSGFSLSAILTQFQCPCKLNELHNAGNDATYTLHIMVVLAIKWATSKDLTKGEFANVGRLQSFIQTELYETPRWKPIRCALGAHCPDDDVNPI
ncbi:hypothetical protein F5B20DRAFT_8053 [Whalleya microplaca]|nr:hypothetical protein F5B20DRAFT_8053 [Whalleya microplaca]